MERIKQMDSQRASAPNHFYRPAPGEIIPQRLVVRQDEKMVFLDTKEIIFITREKRKTVIYTTKNKLTTTENLNSIQQHRRKVVR